MTVQFSDPVTFSGDTPSAEALRVLGGEAAQEGYLRERLQALQSACHIAEAMPAWGFVWFPLGVSAYIALHTRHRAAGPWQSTLRCADLSAAEKQGAELSLEQLLQASDENTSPAFLMQADERFQKALRSAALLTCLDSGCRFSCRVPGGAKAQPHGESLLRGLLRNALPAQHHRFLRFAAGTGNPMALDCHICVAIAGEGKAPMSVAARGAAADFTAAPPALLLQFSELRFAQRTARALLGRLDLPFLLSMWNAAERVVIETVGAKDTAQAQDLVTWQMLRKNFGNRNFSITQEEHAHLVRGVRLFTQRAQESA
ncbi:MAG: hypothetical protein LBC83_02905 [Oscillospiraceae bacterium]|nr:hypothetical protein [Oscillospiraceae bacterium]